MHPDFLDILRCPATGEVLTLEAENVNRHGMVMSGWLSSSRKRYPIIRGIPRFVCQEAYAASFGFEWDRWPRVQFDSENVGRPMEGHTTRMWERITGTTTGDLSGRTIVDFGCGSGRFLDVVRRRGGRAVGIDLSGAVEAARKNFADDPDVLVVQGDLLRPPFAQGCFDGGFSIGVLHHTPNPALGAASLARSIRPDGWIACCVYPRGDFYDFRSVRRFRRLHLAMKRFVGYRFAMSYAWVAATLLAPISRRLKRTPLARAVWYVEKNWLVILWLKDRRWRVLDVFDAITPELASTHTKEEVHRWLRDAGCKDIVATPWCPTSAAAVRSAQGALSRAA